MRRHKNKNEALLFWRDVYIAGGQVTFGVVAAMWFLPPFDNLKVSVLVLNGFVTAMFVLMGYKIAKRL
jgi:hypothetical protein